MVIDAKTPVGYFDEYGQWKDIDKTSVPMALKTKPVILELVGCTRLIVRVARSSPTV